MSDLETIRRLSPQRAQLAIDTLVGGEPPTLEIVDLISVGLERDLKTFEREYFRPTSFLVSEAGSTFKIVEAYYGGGKTHYLRAVERTAHRHNFASAFVGLKKNECPLTRFDLIFAAVAESLSIPRGEQLPPVRGIGAVIRHWIDTLRDGAEDPMQELQRRIDAIGDLPLMSIKIALRTAALAYASGDEETFAETLVYLTSGKISAGLRKRGVLQTIDDKNGSLALRTMAALLRKLGYAGFVLILDEGDRSLSIFSAVSAKAASNNLVQLINETAKEGDWPGTMLLYSIPSWQSFLNAFGDNQALIQRTEPTGFPLIPPAKRIVLDDRQHSAEEKRAFCTKLAERLNALYEAAYPGYLPAAETLTKAARIMADRVLHYETESTFRRLFVRSYLSALYLVADEGALTVSDADAIVTGQMA